MSAAMPISGDISLEALVSDSFKRSAMRPVKLEGKDGILVGGIIIVRGEREFDLLCAFINQHARKE